MGRVSTEPKTSLRKAMNMRGVTAARLSELTGVPMGSINSIAAGFSKCSTKRVAVFADALRVTPEELRDITANTDFLYKPAKPKPTRLNALHAPANKEGIVVQPPMSETGVTPEELRDVAGGKNCGSTDFLAKPAKRTELHAPANKDGIVIQPPMSETEKLRLYMNQLERRVRALEAQVKELTDD